MENNYEFNIQDEELDLLGEDVFPTISKPGSEYKPETKEEEIPEEPTLDDILGEPTSENHKEKTSEEIPEEPLVEVADDTYQKLSQDLLEMGIFTLDEGEETISVKSPEELAERFKKNFQKGAISHIKNIVGQFGPEYEEAWNVIFEKGLNPYDYFTLQKKIDNIESLDITNEFAQKQVLRTYFEKQGFSEDVIEHKLQKAIDRDDLEEDAKEYFPLLVAAEKAQLAKQIEQTEQKRQMIAKQEYDFANSVFSTLSQKLVEKEIDGIPFNQKDVDVATDFYYTKKYQLPTGELITEADKWWIELKSNPTLAAKFALFASNGFDVSKIEKKGVSKQNTTLFNNLTQQNKVAARKQPIPAKNNFFD